MKQLQLIVEIKEEEYSYSKEGYSTLLEQVKKIESLIDQVLIDTGTKRAYCYSNSINNNNNLIA